MTDCELELKELAKEFRSVRKLLNALGDENRLHLILEMMQMDKPEGARVGEITKQTNLSRPAVSHHLAILKDAGIVRVRREGTKNYYYFDDKSGALKRLIGVLSHAGNIMLSAPHEEEK